MKAQQSFTIASRYTIDHSLRPFVSPIFHFLDLIYLQFLMNKSLKKHPRKQLHFRTSLHANQRQITSETVSTFTVAIGTDLVWIPDIQKSIQEFGARYLARVFTDQEVSSCRRPDGALRIESLAARFAAKEALFKLLRAGKDIALPWTAIEIIRVAGTASEIHLAAPIAQLAKLAGLKNFSLSMSHDHDYASATVVALQTI